VLAGRLPIIATGGAPDPREPPGGVAHFTQIKQNDGWNQFVKK
jgi:hypothetical protein